MSAIGAQATAEEALRLTIDYTKSREVFGRPVSRFQYIAFEMAKMATGSGTGARLPRQSDYRAYGGAGYRQEGIDGPVLDTGDA